MQAGTVHCKKAKYPQVRVIIPKLLICSQLPVDTVYPLEVTLRVVDEHNGSAGERSPQAGS